MAEQDALIALTAEIVTAHVSNNNVASGDMPNLIQQVHGALARLSQPADEAPQPKSPVVSVRASIKPDYIVCMECGRKQRTLRRHLQTAHGMTPEQYRKDYGLPDSYPLTAPNYSQQRREMARAAGLGRRKQDTPATQETRGMRKPGPPAAAGRARSGRKAAAADTQQPGEL